MPGPAEEDNDDQLNEEKICADIRKVTRYVKEELFLRVIDIYDPRALVVKSGYLYKDFEKRCKTMVTGLGENESLTDETKGYMRCLWSQMLVKKCYRISLCLKRSNAYQAVQDRFIRK